MSKSKARKRRGSRDPRVVARKVESHRKRAPLWRRRLVRQRHD